MVKGLPKFREHFRGYEHAYILIGGAACDEWFNARGLRFRVTKDLDIVLIVEALNPAFLRRFWEFIRAGQYQDRERASGSHEYYRFLRPKNPEYPAMIELFSRTPDGLKLFQDQKIIPIQTREDISSLSAILVNEDYYRLILDTREIHDGLPMVRADGLIPLKARAYIDLSHRTQAGGDVDIDDIRKHRNDVFRLAMILPVGGRYALPQSIRADLKSFLEAFPSGSPDWRDILESLRITIRPPPTPERLQEILTSYFKL